LFVRGVPGRAHAFSGLVYRQIVEMLQGARGEADTRALIVRENMRYARRQLTWFRKEPRVRWLEGAGESAIVGEEARALVREWLADSYPSSS
jgi:tRNA dimethylallyltransferase